MSHKPHKSLLVLIEKLLWWVRYVILFPVLFLVIWLIYLVILMGQSLWEATEAIFEQAWPFEVLSYLIDIVDFTLIAVIMLIILRWVYELFIRPMTMNGDDKKNVDHVLIHDITELKQKLWKVIIISWVVHVFKQVLIFITNDWLDLIYVSATILLLSLALYFIEKVWWDDHGSKKKLHKVHE